MLSKIGLFVVLALAFVLTAVSLAFAATPLVVLLTKLYEPNPAAKAQQGQYTSADVDAPLREYKTPIPQGATMGEPETGTVVKSLSQDKAGPWEKYRVNTWKSTVSIKAMNIEFPAGMTDDAIRSEIKKSFPDGIEYDIWHTVPIGGAK